MARVKGGTVTFSSLNKEDTRIWQELKVAQSHTPVVKEF